MTVAAQALKNPPGQGADIQLAVIGGATVLFSIAAFAAGALGALPPGISTVIVLFGMGIALKVAWVYVARSASSTSRARMATLLSNTALTISSITAIAALPRLTKAAGAELLLVDLLSQLWTVAILMVLAGPVRTLGWRAFAGAFLFGFLGLTGLARLMGRPAIVALGASSTLAVGVWVPITEELCKMIPVAVVLVLALRRSGTRPSLLDVVLLGTWAAAGFSVYENASYGRGAFSLETIPLISLIFPMMVKGSAYGWNLAQCGHVVHTALISLGVGFSLLYRQRLPKAWIPKAWIVGAVAIAAALIEHCSQNSIITGGINEYIGEALLLITLNGRLCALLLLAGVGYVLSMEWRAVGTPFRPREWLQLQPAEIRRRGVLLAALQARPRSAP